MDLHPGLALVWPALREALQPLTVIVDAANVIGSRPDGWWRDRAGAARRLVTSLTELSGAGITEFPAAAGLPVPACWLPDFVVVLEGQARRAADGAAGDGAAGDGVAGGGAAAGDGRLRVVSAPGSGDDAIAKLAGELHGRRLVITADRELRGRCEAAGALVTGPRWLTGLLER